MKAAEESGEARNAVRATLSALHTGPGPAARLGVVLVHRFRDGSRLFPGDCYWPGQRRLRGCVLSIFRQTQVWRRASEVPFDGLPFNRQSGCAPLGQPCFESAGFNAFLAKKRNRVVRHQAVRAAAVRDDFLALGQFPQSPFELVNRDIYRAWQVAGGKLLGRAHV